MKQNLVAEMHNLDKLAVDQTIEKCQVDVTNRFTILQG